MSNYIKVFSGNFIEVQRIFSELENFNICAIIKDESESGRLAGFGPSIQGLQEIHVHKDELDRSTPIIKNLTSKLELD
ncbi:putative signal transducing protein [Algibacter sp.]|uniref:putative signal transducing protein n=1 Tax=Algibacter sp. TaxID=1872428 RepID=UPI003C7936E5